MGASEDFHKEISSRVRYLIIAGDIIDGIGVYPNQINELEIRDIYEQYEIAAKLLSKIPEHIEIVLIPGNHDAVAKALPQPPIPREYAEELYSDERIHILSNPSYISLEGVEVLICHGKALDDILSSKPGLDFQQPAKGMELLLRCRHLAPIYGASTPIVPEGEDRLVIERVPDILHMGHIHIHQIKKYRGVTLIASGSWQSQTSYQRRLEIKPTPGVASIVDLKSLQSYTIDFRALSG
jgi:DNA polymerase II small subunit